MAVENSEKDDSFPRYRNRELSWLKFNRRVLDQAKNKHYPLLERLRFLSFVSSNLDEFYEIRVAGLMQQVDSNNLEMGPDGLTPQEQLDQIHASTTKLVDDQYRCWREDLQPALKEEGIVFKSDEELTPEELAWVTDYFEREVFPVLTPLGIDPAHPFPQLINKGLNILAYLDDPSTQSRDLHLAIIPVPRVLPRAVRIPVADQTTYIFLSEILKVFAARLFPGYKVYGAWEFRITRNSDLYIDEEETENLLQKIEEGLYGMRRGAAVRLEIRKGVLQSALRDLLHYIELSECNVFHIDGPLNLLRLFSVYDVTERSDLKFPAFHPRLAPQFAKADNIFEAIGREDILLHHPYDSFAPVTDFILQASQDPKVFAIKQTLYRTSGDSPIIEALKQASLNGKQVTVLMELKARFDEANNIAWARELEEVGVHVVYGLVGLKTHCKCCLVVRREAHGLRRYAHLGTGNYNPKTAKSYTDISLFTARADYTDEVAALFNALTGFARKPEFHKLLVAPFNLHGGIQKHILREIANAEAGKPARIIIKTNSVVDKQTIDNLYRASNAGVKIDLIVRGICCLVPGVPGQSENIRVRSILGRYLEHSRFFYFENAGAEPILLAGSADLMPRNFFKRIEVVFPIDDPKLRTFVIEEILEVYLKDSRRACLLTAEGTYRLCSKEEDSEDFGAQTHFMQ